MLGKTIASDCDLHLRETLRRKALWALANLTTDDLRAADALDTLDDVDA